MKVNLKIIKSLHGHIGPYVVLGYVMGAYVRRHLSNIDKITIYTKINPPVSCLLDGLQLSTGCTLGKNKIKTIRKKEFEKAVFYKNKRIIIIKLQSILEKMLKQSHRQALQYIKKSNGKTLFKLIKN
ncbi:MAG: formylmethanofuran dehydrogenase subunit E family protein [Patescibacteria group bacterium]|jgi:formylmethanofuran dehydrogenase subunit E